MITLSARTCHDLGGQLDPGVRVLDHLLPGHSNHLGKNLENNGQRKERQNNNNNNIRGPALTCPFLHPSSSLSSACPPTPPLPLPTTSHPLHFFPPTILLYLPLFHPPLAHRADGDERNGRDQSSKGGSPPDDIDEHGHDHQDLDQKGAGVGGVRGASVTGVRGWVGGVGEQSS
jgi:hypothetical protein